MRSHIRWAASNGYVDSKRRARLFKKLDDWSELSDLERQVLCDISDQIEQLEELDNAHNQIAD
jgi:hypothetical protein